MHWINNFEMNKKNVIFPSKKIKTKIIDLPNLK